MAAAATFPSLSACVVLLAALATSGCALFRSGAEAASADPSRHVGAPPSVRGGLAGEADRLLAADRAFAARALEAGAPAAFHEFFAERGMRLPPVGAPVVGRDAVRADLAEKPIVLSWEPRFAEVFAPGDWGWTWGDWQAHEPGAGGRRLAQGRYVNVWRKERDGTWKVRLDMGLVEPEPAR